MTEQISTMVVAIFLLFAIASAQSENHRQDGTSLSSSIDDLLSMFKVRSERVYRQATAHQKSNVFKFTNHKVNTAHYVNVSKTGIEKSANDAVVRVYGEANPRKTDEYLLDVETNTQIMNLEDHATSLSSSGKNIHQLSISGYGPPGEEPETAEMDQKVEVMQVSLSPDVVNPYGGGVPETEAEQRAIIAETSSTSIREDSGLSSITTSKGATSSMESEERFKETGEGVTESNVSNGELIEDTKVACAEDCKTSTGTDKGKMVTELREVSIGSQESSAVSLTDDENESYGASTEQFESKSIGTEVAGMSTFEDEKTESVLEGHGAVSEAVRAKTALKTEAQKIPSKATEVAQSESRAESSTIDSITHAQTKPVNLQTVAGDFGYGVGSETVKEVSGAEENPSSISGNLPGTHVVEPVVISGVGETTYDAANSKVSGEETKNTECENAKLDSSTEGIYSSQEKITETKVSEDTYQNQESVTGTDIAAYQNFSQITLLETEKSTDQSVLTTQSLLTEEATSELFTSPVTNSTITDTSYSATEGVVVSKAETSPVIESTEGISGYETYNKPEGLPKLGLPGLNEESASQLSKSIEEATTLSRTNTETEITDGKRSTALEDTVTEPDLQDSTEHSAGVSETTGFFKEASLTSVEQLPGYGAVIPEYIAGSTYGEEEATDLQKTSEEIEPSSIAPYDTETGHAEEKIVHDDTSTTSSEVFISSVSAEYGATGLFKASESMEGTTASEGTMAVEETSEISKYDEGLVGYGEAGTSEQVSSEEALTGSGIIATKTPEEVIQPSELLTRISVVSEQPIKYGGETLASESTIKGTETSDVTTPFIEQAVPSETIVSGESVRTAEQPLGYGELSVTTDTDGSYESNKEAPLEQPTTHGEQAMRYGSSTIRISAEDFGYGGGEEGITERSNKLHSVPTINAEETTESPSSSQQYAEFSESEGAKKSTGGEADYVKGASVTESTKQLTSGEIAATSESSGSAPGYVATGVLFNPSDYYPAGEEPTNELSRSDKELTGQQEFVANTSISIPESSEKARVGEETTSFTSLTESPASDYAVSEGEKFTEAPIAETVSAEIESNKISTDTDDFGYGGGVQKVTEAELIGQTQDSKTSVAMAESTLTTQGMQFTDGTKTESIQQPSATETSPVGCLTGNETNSTIGSAETSLQYSASVGNTSTHSGVIHETVKTAEASETGSSIIPGQTFSRYASESTLMHIITSAAETPVPHSISEEAPKVIAMTKVTKTGLSKLTGDTSAVTEEAKEVTGMETTDKSNLETTKEFKVEGTKSMETSDKVENEMGSISSKTTWIGPESMTTTAGNTVSEFYAENSAEIPAKIPIGPEDFGYGSENELSSSISSNAESVMTFGPKLSSNVIETSFAPELAVSSEYTSSETFIASESKSSEELLSATVPSVTSNVVTESFTATQKMLEMEKESIAREEERNIPSRIPTDAKQFGYGSDTEEQSITGSSRPSSISKGDF
ncbi:hypothetical protein LOAG_02844 [Loa loa]|uniref:Mucin-22-like n=1 Tax=Loa loa TaxID=7209 RepID=A0A1I7VRU1_LOALO|nr:hypothetical protein LOAG_02844 [Loa loa]EFO25637.1 hypothetical protein LOAG_02844 [Loa loa]